MPSRSILQAADKDTPPCAATTLDPVTRAFGFACDTTFTCVQCQTTTTVVEQHTHLSLEPMQTQVSSKVFCGYTSTVRCLPPGTTSKQRARAPGRMV